MAVQANSVSREQNKSEMGKKQRALGPPATSQWSHWSQFDLMTYNTGIFQIERERIFQGPPSQSQPSSHDLARKRKGGCYRHGFHGHGPQSQPQPSKVMEAEWAVVLVELSIVPIGPPPPQCQARLYIIGSRLTRSDFRSSVDALSLVNGYRILVF
jgi:hypothetical protein